MSKIEVAEVLLALEAVGENATCERAMAYVASIDPLSLDGSKERGVALIDAVRAAQASGVGSAPGLVAEEVSAPVLAAMEKGILYLQWALPRAEAVGQYRGRGRVGLALNALLEERSAIEGAGVVAPGLSQSDSGVMRALRDAHDLLNADYAITTSPDGRRAVGAMNAMRVAMTVLQYGLEAAPSHLPIKPYSVEDLEVLQADSPPVWVPGKAGAAVAFAIDQVPALAGVPKEIDVTRPLYDEAGTQHTYFAANARQVVTTWRGQFAVWDRRTGECLMENVDSKLSNEQPDPRLVQEKREAAAQLWADLQAQAAARRAVESQEAIHLGDGAGCEP